MVPIGENVLNGASGTICAIRLPMDRKWINNITNDTIVIFDANDASGAIVVIGLSP